jgi:hypothetical protein
MTSQHARVEVGREAVERVAPRPPAPRRVPLEADLAQQRLELRVAVAIEHLPHLRVHDMVSAAAAWA